MFNSFDDFYRNLNLQEFLDDDLILQFKDNNTQLQEFLLSNGNIVTQMLEYLQIDEFETDHKRIIKYPFMVSEILSAMYVLNDQHIQFLLSQLNNTQQLPSITIGYICKILMNTLKNQPVKFWQYVQQQQIDVIMRDINNYAIVELIYSMIIFQTQENQLDQLDKRINLIDILIGQINSVISEGISNVICLILQQITDTLQEQKAQIIKYIFTKINDFISLLYQQPKAILSIFCALIKHQQWYERESAAIYNIFSTLSKEVKESLFYDDDKFGLNNLSYVQFYDLISNEQYFLQHVDSQDLTNVMFQLLQKYQFNNQLHKFASSIICKLIPAIESSSMLCKCIQEVKLLPIRPNRGYLLMIINKIYEQNQNQQQLRDIELLNEINNNYMLGVIPDQKPVFNLQEEVEAAMNKLQI